MDFMLAKRLNGSEGPRRVRVMSRKNILEKEFIVGEQSEFP
jgi:hypothetical protein